MSKETLWQEVEDRLRNNPTLKGYVKNVYNWNREAVLDAELPCIIMHPLPADEVYADFPKRKQDFLKIQIRGILDIRNRRNTVVVGDNSQVGILRFEEDIKNAIENVQSGLTDDLNYVVSGTAQGHYPKLRTVEYRNEKDTSAVVIIEAEIDGRYFFVGQR